MCQETEVFEGDFWVEVVESVFRSGRREVGDIKFIKVRV